jgi:hypothetical protein
VYSVTTCSVTINSDGIKSSARTTGSDRNVEPQLSVCKEGQLNIFILDHPNPSVDVTQLRARQAAAARLSHSAVLSPSAKRPPIHPPGSQIQWKLLQITTGPRAGASANRSAKNRGVAGGFTTPSKSPKLESPRLVKDATLPNGPGATVVLQWCYSGVTMVLQWCQNGVTMVLQWCYSGVTVVLQWCYNGLTLQ